MNPSALNIFMLSIALARPFAFGDQSTIPVAASKGVAAAGTGNVGLNGICLATNMISLRKCKPNHVCNAFMANGRCKALAGANCSIDTDCASNRLLKCDGGVCKNPLSSAGSSLTKMFAGQRAAGEKCSSFGFTPSTMCMKGLGCKKGVCTSASSDSNNKPVVAQTSREQEVGYDGDLNTIDKTDSDSISESLSPAVEEESSSKCDGVKDRCMPGLEKFGAV